MKTLHKKDGIKYLTNLTDLSKCKLCEKPPVQGGLCYPHHRAYKLEQWLDNTDRDNLGIVLWAKELMPEFAFNETPDFHKDLYLTLLSLYNPRLRNKYERLRGLISFRGSAKSTAANTLFVAYIVANNGKKFKIIYNGEVEEFLIDERTIIIISETFTSAQEFTVRIRDAFSENERLRYYYRVAITQALDALTGQWSRGAFRINDCYVQAVGSGQQIRGKVKGASRPSLVIADDIYSENSVITEERRTGTRWWWNNAVMKSIDDLRGKVILLGTIVHDDTVLVDIRTNPRWQVKQMCVMPPEKFHRFVEEHLNVDWESATCKLPHDDIKDVNRRAQAQRLYFDKVQASEDWELAWAERIDLYLLALMYQEAIHNSTVSGLYQEYFHITLSPYERRFKREYFQPLRPYELKQEYGMNWIKFQGEDQEWKVVNVEFGIDLAGGGMDDAVITVIASTDKLQIYVLHQAIGKWSIRDNIDAIDRINRVTLDRGAVQGVGIIDETFRLAKRYKPSKIKVGIAGEEALIMREFRRVFEENRDYTQILGRPQFGGRNALSKEDRIRNTMLPFYETRMVYHAPHLDKLEYQLEYLGKSTHDDCADAAECAFYTLDFPQNIDIDFFTPKEPITDRFGRWDPQTGLTKLYKEWRTL